MGGKEERRNGVRERERGRVECVTVKREDNNHTGGEWYERD